MEQINAHSIKIEDVISAYDTDLSTGLKNIEAIRRLEKYGKNELIKEKGKTAWDILISQFKDFLIYLLIFAVVISVIIGLWESSKPGATGWSSEYIDAIVILAILILNAILGFYQEYQAEKSLESLKKLAPHFAKVRRDGIVQEIGVLEVVPGDIVLVGEGDKFPADIRLIKEFSLYVDEAILTGESQPVKKQLDIVDVKEILADRTNLGYMNTIITRGNGEGITIGTGMNTEIGKIAGTLQEEVIEPSPFQKEVNKFGKLLGIIIIVICAAVFILEVILILVTGGATITEQEIDQIIEAFEIAISLAVSAVPEGLVVVITVVMSIGMKKMADRHALVRKLTAVETLGRVNVICSDKTGTLTKNEMTVVKMFVTDKELDVTGVGYNINGDILENGRSVTMNDDIDKFLESCLLCNNSNVPLTDRESGDFTVVGDPTEISMKVLAIKGGIAQDFEKLDEIPFNSDRKMMTVIGKREGKIIAYIKGAPDVLMRNASKVLINGEIKPIGQYRDIILNKNEEFAKNALRVLGVAYKELNPNYDINEIEKDFTYIGLVGIIDPARDEVKLSIQEARNAGIRTIMITGDHKITAIAIANQIGLTDSDEAVTGVELEEMSEDELREKVKTVDVFARVTSFHKLRILRRLKELDMVVSMTGDGVNDAPAVKGAHVGVAMGLKGTEVTQEASEMILTDDNYSTIVNAIEEGRGIYETTKGFFRYMLSTNFDEIFLILTAYIVMKIFVNVFLGPPVIPLQILWLNIATDGIPAMVLGLTPTDPDVMKQKPRKGFTLIHEIRGPVLFLGIYTSITDITLYLLLWTWLLPTWSAVDPNLIAIYNYSSELGTLLASMNPTEILNTLTPSSPLYSELLNYIAAKEYAITLSQTIIFTNLVFCELMFVFTCTSNIKPFYKFPNKHLFWAVGLSAVLQFILMYTPLGLVFHIMPLTEWYHWVTVFTAAFSISVVDEIRKYILRRKQRKNLDSTFISI